MRINSWPRYVQVISTTVTPTASLSGINPVFGASAWAQSKEQIVQLILTYAYCIISIKLVWYWSNVTISLEEYLWYFQKSNISVHTRIHTQLLIYNCNSILWPLHSSQLNLTDVISEYLTKNNDSNAPETQTYVCRQVLDQPRPSPGLGHTLHSLLSQRRWSSTPGLRKPTNTVIVTAFYNILCLVLFGVKPEQGITLAHIHS